MKILRKPGRKGPPAGWGSGEEKELGDPRPVGGTSSGCLGGKERFREQRDLAGPRSWRRWPSGVDCRSGGARRARAHEELWAVVGEGQQGKAWGTTETSDHIHQNAGVGAEWGQRRGRGVSPGLSAHPVTAGQRGSGDRHTGDTGSLSLGHLLGLAARGIGAWPHLGAQQSPRPGQRALARGSVSKEVAFDGSPDTPSQ